MQCPCAYVSVFSGTELGFQGTPFYIQFQSLINAYIPVLTCGQYKAQHNQIGPTNSWTVLWFCQHASAYWNPIWLASKLNESKRCCSHNACTRYHVFLKNSFSDFSFLCWLFFFLFNRRRLTPNLLLTVPEVLQSRHIKTIFPCICVLPCIYKQWWVWQFLFLLSQK